MRRNPVIMMCYKDRTWCVHSRDCSNTTCDRNLNENEIKQATEWWKAISDNCGGRDFPVAKADFKTDECGWRAKTSLTCCKSACEEDELENT